MSSLSAVLFNEDASNEQVDETTLKYLLSKFYFWRDVGIQKDIFVKLNSTEQDQLIIKFYFDKINENKIQNVSKIDSTIVKKIQNALGITMKKVIDNNKTEMKIETINDNQEKQQKVWKNFGHFDNAPITF